MLCWEIRRLLNSLDSCSPGCLCKVLWKCISKLLSSLSGELEIQLWVPWSDTGHGGRGSKSLKPSLISMSILFFFPFLETACSMEQDCQSLYDNSPWQTTTESSCYFFQDLNIVLAKMTLNSTVSQEDAWGSSGSRCHMNYSFLAFSLKQPTIPVFYAHKTHLILHIFVQFFIFIHAFHWMTYEIPS